jgi:hypothetical protein
MPVKVKKMRVQGKKHMKYHSIEVFWVVTPVVLQVVTSFRTNTYQTTPLTIGKPAKDIFTAVKISCIKHRHYKTVLSVLTFRV